MTFILALANKDYVIQLSDRRLLRNGKVFDDESNKAGFLICDDARLVFGFTGLAEYGRFKTRRWILDLLSESAPPDHLAREMLQRFTHRATEAFRTHPEITAIPAEHKRLSVIFTGFVNDSRIANCIITNYQDFDSGLDLPTAVGAFRLYPWISKAPSQARFTLVQRVGTWTAMLEDDERVLRAMLEAGKPRRAVLGKAVKLVRDMAARPAAAGHIGGQISSVCLTKDSLVPVTAYHTKRLGERVYVVDQVNLRSGSPLLAISDFCLRVPGQVVSVPKVRRNEPCPCGNGKKYKYCHGKR